MKKYKVVILTKDGKLKTYEDVTGFNVSAFCDGVTGEFCIDKANILEMDVIDTTDKKSKDKKEVKK